MFLPPRGAEHGVFAGDQNATDGQRVWGYGLEDLAPPNNVAQPAASPYTFQDASLVFLWRNTTPGLEKGRLLPLHVKEFACLIGGRRSTGEPFGNQPLSRVLGAHQDRRLLHSAC